jgi:hypothetical protein
MMRELRDPAGKRVERVAVPRVVAEPFEALPPSSTAKWRIATDRVTSRPPEMGDDRDVTTLGVDVEFR